MALVYKISPCGQNVMVETDLPSKADIQNRFKDLHVLNFKDGEKLEEIEIYKFIKLEHLLTWKKNGCIFLDRVGSWEDPYENHLLKNQFYLKNGFPFEMDNQITGIFGQCWSTIKESDALWRIYSPNKETVRIKTTAQKLFDTIYIDNQCMAATWIGKVKYLKQKQIEKIDKNIINEEGFGALTDIIAKSMFQKRKEFSHESELRIIHTLDSTQAKQFEKCKFLQFKIDIDDFIKEITIDPRCNQDEYNKIKATLISAGVWSTTINRSELYHYTPQDIYTNI